MNRGKFPAAVIVRCERDEHNAHAAEEAAELPHFPGTRLEDGRNQCNGRSESEDHPPVDFVVVAAERPISGVTRMPPEAKDAPSDKAEKQSSRNCSNNIPTHNYKLFCQKVLYFERIVLKGISY